MKITIKEAVGVAIAVSAVLAAVSAVAYVKSYTRSVDASASSRSFTVTGEGKVRTAPDVAKFSAGVVTEGGKDLAALQEQNSARANAVVEYLKSKGIDAEDIATSQYNVESRYQNVRCEDGVCPPAEIVGYTVRQTVAVTVRDLKAVGELLSGVVASGANNVSGLHFAVEDPVKAQAEARAEAMKRAREQAEAMAEAGGFRVGKLLAVDEGGTVMPFHKMIASDVAMEARGSAAPAIEPGTEEVTVQVTLRYGIK